MERLRILALTKYGRKGASSRMRSMQYQPFLAQAGFEVSTQPLLSDELLASRYQHGKYNSCALIHAYTHRVAELSRRAQFDLIWVEKEALPWWPVVVESLLLRGTPYVLDYDDAIFHNYDLHPRKLVRALYGSRLDSLMKRAALVIGGNRYLAQRAIDAGSSWVEILPTVVDLDRYRVSVNTYCDELNTAPRIVWIGSPSTSHYLKMLREPLRQISQDVPFVLRVIGAMDVDLPGVNVEYVPWSEDTEVASIASCAVGIMPLESSPWELGKCGYKLIQYMACGLPVVASSVGANTEIVEHQHDGYLVDSSDGWAAALRGLLKSRDLRQKMGRAGRMRVEQNYCLQKTGPFLATLLLRASNIKK